ncbi:MAG: hypothetical protein KTR20_15945 [Cellvibrionaceae bacterium]|nr:hypothetical protein [Cellvibrionaceae bacterium]
MLDVLEEKTSINFEEFEKVVMKTAQVIAVSDVPNSRKLLAFDLRCGNKKFQIFSGIKKHYPNYDVLTGKYVVFVENLAPRTIMGKTSHGMLLTVENHHGDVSLLFGPPELGDNAQVL